MRGIIAASYFMAIGYVIAKTGADEEFKELMMSSYRKLLHHTLTAAQEIQAENAKVAKALTGQAVGE